MTIGHALPALTYLSFVCNRYELPNSNTRFMETIQQDGRMVWVDKSCPRGCVFANCQCVPAGPVGQTYMAPEMVRRCNSGIYRVRSENVVPAPPLSGYTHISRTGTGIRRMVGQSRIPTPSGSNMAASGRFQEFRQGNKQIFLNEPDPRRFMNSMFHSRTNTIRPNRVIYRTGGMNRIYRNGGMNRVNRNGKANGIYVNGRMNGVYRNGGTNRIYTNGKINGMNRNGGTKNIYTNGKINGMNRNGGTNRIYTNGQVNGIYRNGGMNNRPRQIYTMGSSNGMNGRKVIYTNGGSAMGVMNSNNKLSANQRKTVKNNKISDSQRKHIKRKPQYGRYGDRMDKNNFDQFQQNLQAANGATNGLTKAFTKTENVVMERNGTGFISGRTGITTSGSSSVGNEQNLNIQRTTQTGNGLGSISGQTDRTTSGSSSTSSGTSDGTQRNLNFQRTTHEEFLKMQKYGDIFGKNKPSTNVFSNFHSHDHSHGYSHSHEHGGHHHGHDHGNTIHTHTHHHNGSITEGHEHVDIENKEITKGEVVQTDSSVDIQGIEKKQIFGNGDNQYTLDTKSDASGSGSITAAARKQTIEVVDTSGVGGFSENTNQNIERSDSSATSTGFVVDGSSTGINSPTDSTQTNVITETGSSNNEVNSMLAGIDSETSLKGNNNDVIGGSVSATSTVREGGENINTILTGIGGGTSSTVNDNKVISGSVSGTSFEKSGGNINSSGTSTLTRTTSTNTQHTKTVTTTTIDGNSRKIKIDLSSMLPGGNKNTEKSNTIDLTSVNTDLSQTDVDTNTGSVQTTSSNEGGTGNSRVDVSSVGGGRQIVIIGAGRTVSAGSSTGTDVDVSKSVGRDGNNNGDSSGFTSTETKTETMTGQNIDVTKTVDNSIIENTGVGTNTLISDSSLTGGSSTKDGFVIDNTKDNRVITDTYSVDTSQSTGTVVDSTFPVIGGVTIGQNYQLGQTAEQRKTEVVITEGEEELHLSSDVCKECEILDGGIGYIYHPKHCDMFIMCIPSMDGTMKPVAQVCPHGQYWDQSSITCRPSQLTICPFDLCYRKQSLMENQTHAHRSNCRAYWRCSGGYSHEQCCPKGKSYRSEVGCVTDSTCMEPCGFEMEKPTNWTKGCDKKPIPRHPKKYEWNTHFGPVPMDCAPGTLFNEELCQCIYSGNPIPGTSQPVLEPVCTPEIHLPFDDDFMDHSGKNSHVYNNNATLDGTGAACFDGNAAISLPMLTNMDFGTKMYAKIRYRQPFTTDEQALLYNGNCLKEPSLVVTSSTTNNNIEVITSYGKNSTMDLMSSTPADEWRHVVLHIHGNELDVKTDQDHKSLQITGGIARTQCGLKLGWGKDYPGFVGCIDDFVLYRCFPDNM